ncbi:4Fe-4S binding protein [Pseudomaricurvus alcaniphilus]|uniref:NosR/NirI family protein n=1 Tax=Pseudomaricurvus alcaniphilus TaxID=1166482 RepID=UPI00140BA77A|nr:NosR/NirI family protein [Pseudomaricurvus alcaniphilus]NHN39758.1 4Fe-4S binding protein [Pseudomaricurvus alcaniphilus]
MQFARPENPDTFWRRSVYRNAQLPHLAPKPQPGLLVALLLALLLALVLFSAWCRGDEQAFDLQDDIQAIFPSATVIGAKQQATPVWPVYQLNELIGYAFESNDFVDLPGFSGDRVNLLIGIDTEGRFRGLKILRHHEPIFLHGLGPKPLLEFIEQYNGHRVSDRIIVGSRSGGAKSGAAQNGGSAASSAPQTAYFDGVTKATVSVIVINDTILSSALQVARKLLAEFSQAAAATINTELFEPLTVDELLAKGYLRRWHLPAPDIAASLGSGLDSYLQTDAQANYATAPVEQGITLYYAYLNVPSIGRNMLGDAEYARVIAQLGPNEHAIAIKSEGFYSYLEPWFRPGTVPERVGLVQHGLPMTLRDLNFYDDEERKPRLSATDEDADANNLQIFKINSQSGFDPASAMQLTLRVSLQKNHLVADEHVFSDDYQLPETLFHISAPTVVADDFTSSLWWRLWRERALETGVLLLGLLMLSVAFSRQQALSSRSRWLHRFRWAYLTFTLLFIGFYAQGQLSVVNIYTLLLELIDGFSLDVFLLDPIIFILWIFTVISLLLWGRGLYCGWLCPFGALQEFASLLAKKLGFRQISIKPKYHRPMLLIKYLILVGLVATSLFSLTLAEQLAEVEPFKTSITLLFVRSAPFVIYALLLLGVGMFIHKFYCRYLCPLGAGLAILGKLRMFEWLDRRRECGQPCQLCRHRCEINAIKRDGSIDYDECVQCLECVVIIQDPRQCAPARLEDKNRNKLLATSLPD